MSKDIVKKDGKVEWTHLAGDSYLVTGTDRQGRRFKIKSNNFLYADGINAWKGRIWLVRDGKRHLLKTISN